VLFIAAGAFHRAKPSDLMPELQGRSDPRGADRFNEGRFHSHSDRTQKLAHQAIHALLSTEGVELEFTPMPPKALAEFAFRVNQTTQNIGAPTYIPLGRGCWKN